MGTKLYVWYFKPTDELILSNRKNWPQRRGLELYDGYDSWYDENIFWWSDRTYIAKHQFEFLGEL